MLHLFYTKITIKGILILDYQIILEQLANDELNPLQNIDIENLIDYMIENIGNPDPYIRDTLVYFGFSKLLLKHPIEDKILHKLLTICMDDEHLFYKIDEQIIDDSVFTRSFSALVIALVLYQDAKTPALPKDILLPTLTASINYLKREYDYRGYVEQKGWAHSVAHGSDLLANAVAHPQFENVATIEECLCVLQKCLHTDYAFIDEEDDRMLPVLDMLFEKGLSDHQLKQWLIQLHTIEDELKKARIYWNVKKFTMTLYVHLIRTNNHTETKDWIYSTIILNENIS